MSSDSRLSLESQGLRLHSTYIPPPIPPNPFILCPYKANSHPPPPMHSGHAVLRWLVSPTWNGPSSLHQHTPFLFLGPLRTYTHTLLCTPKFAFIPQNSRVLILVGRGGVAVGGSSVTIAFSSVRGGGNRGRFVELKAFGPKGLHVP